MDHIEKTRPQLYGELLSVSQYHISLSAESSTAFPAESSINSSSTLDEPVTTVSETYRTTSIEKTTTALITTSQIALSSFITPTVVGNISISVTGNVSNTTKTYDLTTVSSKNISTSRNNMSSGSTSINSSPAVTKTSTMLSPRPITQTLSTQYREANYGFTNHNKSADDEQIPQINSSSRPALNLSIFTMLSSTVILLHL